ncbi:MAG: PPC domain-containing DNA-binding protein [Polyangiaceae bacterium]
MLLACAAPEYTKGGPVSATGKAPGVRVHVLSEHEGRRTFVIAFGPGDEVMAGLSELARARGWKSAHFSGIGSFSSATLGWYDFGRKEFKKIPRKGTLEVASFSGNVTLDQDDTPIVHAHTAVADEQGELTGGHVFDATVAATLELFLTEEPTAVRKAPDEALGTKVIQ